MRPGCPASPAGHGEAPVIGSKSTSDNSGDRSIPAIGIYEKALRATGSWEDLLRSAGTAGFDFLEMSVDAVPHRLARLNWSAQKRVEVKAAIERTRVPIRSIVLSAHRSYPLGSPDPGTRHNALGILQRGVALAADLGAEVVQLAGYFAYSENRSGGERALFIQGLQSGVEWASAVGVKLAIENMDGQDITSIADAVSVIDEVGSPWLSLYPDIGNLAANGLDVCSQLILGRDRMVAVQLKDARLNEFRRIAFGHGIVPFDEVFSLLREMRFGGPFAVEMWNDATSEPWAVAAHARTWILERMSAGGLI